MSKVIVVTGSSSGFGKATVETLAAEGHTVFATMRNTKGSNAEKADSLTKWAEDNNYNLTVEELDVTNIESVKNAVDNITAQAGQIDVLVNNAGGGGMGVLEDHTLNEFKKVFEVNVFGIVNTCNAVVPQMRQRGEGLIINISSTIGRMAFPLMAPYVSSKWAVEGLTQSLNAELAAVGIDAVIVEPGAFPSTDFFGKMSGYSPANTNAFTSYGPLTQMPENFDTMMSGMVESGQAPEPVEVAKAVSKLIDTPKGSRPLRTVVDPAMENIGQQLEAYNKAAAELQQALEQTMAPQEA